MKKTVLLLSLLFIFNLCFSQGNEKNDTVKYSIIEDIPQFDFISGSFEIPSLNFNMNSFPVGLVGGIDFSFGPIYGGASYILAGTLADADFIETSETNYAKSIYTPRNKKSELNTYIGYPIKKYESTKEVSVHVKRKGDINYFIWVDATEEKQISLEAGVTSGYSFYQSNKFKAMPVDPITSDGRIMTEPIEINASTTLAYNVLNIGFSVIKKHDLVISLGERGHRRSNSFERIYGAISYRLSSVMDDVSRPIDGNWGDWLNSSPDHYKFILNDFTPMHNFGFKIGKTRFKAKGSGLYTKAEVGYFPGPKVGFYKNLYFYYGFGLNISTLFKE